MTDFTGALSERLASRVPRIGAEWDARPAAVLVPLYVDAGEWHILFTERTETVEDHKGQVSFPGGRVDDGDADRVQTALREAHEEIGLQPQHVRVLGWLDELFTVTQYRVTPVVGVIPWPYRFVLSTDELSEVFGAPLKWLADSANRETRHVDHPVLGQKVPVYFYHYEGHTIWGATARMVVNLVEVARPLLDYTARH